MKVYQSRFIARKVKRLKPAEKAELDQVVRDIIDNLAVGDEKKGDLKGVFIYKFKLHKNDYLLAYRICSENSLWQCAFEHAFTAKAYTVLKAGHWCPECLPPPWNYDEIAKRNPFFAQVWYPNHDKTENNFYHEDCYEDIVD